MAEAEAKETRSGRARRETPPFLAVATLVVAVLGGALARWPDARAARADSVAASAESRETLEAARSLLRGDGFTVADGTVRRAARVPAGAVVPAAASMTVLGDAPASPLFAEAVVSTAAILLAAAAGIAAAGWWAGASAATLLAALPAQIDATRVVSAIPLATMLVAAAAFVAVLALRDGRGNLGLALAAGAIAGIGYGVHPAVGLAACGIVAAALPRPAAALGSIVGTALGVTPLALQRAMSYGSPLVSSERAAEPGAFHGSPGSTLADWVGLDLATPGAPLPELRAFLIGDGHFERIVLGTVAVLALAAFFRGGGARALLVASLGAFAALAGVVSLAGSSSALTIPPAATLTILFAFVALLFGLGISALGRLGPFGSLVAVGVLCVTIALEHRDVARAVRSSPGLFTERDAAQAATSAATSHSTATPHESGIGEVRAAEKPEIPDATPDHAPAKTAHAPAQSPLAPTQSPLAPTQGRATSRDLATAKSLVAGEGGATHPSVALEGDVLTLGLRLESDHLTADNAVPDAVRLTLKIVDALPQLEVLRVRVTAKDGRPLSSTLVSAEKARAFVPKLDDPFESRRMREWWPAMEAR